MSRSAGFDGAGWRAVKGGLLVPRECVEQEVFVPRDDSMDCNRASIDLKLKERAHVSESRARTDQVTG